MDFTLDETQQAVAEAARGVLRRNVEGTGGEVLRGDPGYDEALWKEMAKAGLLTLALPENLGGAGLDAAETAVVLTEVGRTVAAVPAMATLALGVLPLVRLGSAAQQQAVLAEVEHGRVLTAALNEVSAPMQASPATVARCPQVRQVGACLGLAVADGEVRLAGKDARQEEVLLLLAAVALQRRPYGLQGDVGQRERTSPPRGRSSSGPPRPRAPTRW